MAKKARPGVYCIEGEWSTSLKDLRSVRPMLQILRDVSGIESVYSPVSVPEALDLAVDRLKGRRYSRYSIVYFAPHGSPGAIYVGDDEIRLSSLAERLDGACEGKILHFGSCQTLKRPREEIERFREQTGAQAVSGFVKNVWWLESAAFELIYLQAAASYRRIAYLEKYVQRRYRDFADRVGFKI